MWVKLEFHFRLNIIGIFNLVSNLIHHHRQVLKNIYPRQYKFRTLRWTSLSLNYYSPRCIFHDASVPQPYLVNLIHIIPMNTHRHDPQGDLLAVNTSLEQLIDRIKWKFTGTKYLRIWEISVGLAKGKKLYKKKKRKKRKEKKTERKGKKRKRERKKEDKEESKE